MRWRARVAKAAVSAQVGNDESTKKSKEKDAHDGCFGTGLSWLDGVAAGAVGSSLLSYQLVHHNSILTKTMSISTLLLGPYAAYQKRKLRELGSLRQQQNSLRNETNEFQVQNEVFHRKLQRLDLSVTNLESVETELSLFAKDRTELKRLKHVVERQNEVHKRMKKCLQNQVLQDILEVVVQADQDRDFQISPQELEVLALRMNGIPGVQFNERNFRALMAAGDRRISSVFSMIRTLMSDDDDSNDIFTFRPEELMTEIERVV